MIKVYLSGSTIRVVATFYDFNKVKTDPQIVKFVLYDSKYNVISEVSIGTENRISTGVFYYDHIIQKTDVNKKFCYEMYGEIGGKPSLKRKEFTVKFLNG